SALYFYSPIHRPPCSPLFPYTTLFRSLFVYRAIGSVQLPRRLGDLEIVEAVPQRLLLAGTVACGLVYGVLLTLGRAASAASCHADRKSTRLNSSHVSISYAVFCLKKKT